jgi:hypothetical protein
MRKFSLGSDVAVKFCKLHPIVFCSILVVILLGSRIGGGIYLNLVSPQMLFPGYSLIDYMQMKFVEYPLPYRMCIDVPVAWGNGRFRLAETSGFVDQKYCWDPRQNADPLDCINNRGETVTFYNGNFFSEVSIFRYKSGFIYAYSQKCHIFIMIDVRSEKYTYVNKPESLPSPHREEFSRLLSGSRGNYTYKDAKWNSDPNSTFSDAEAPPPLKKASSKEFVGKFGLG